MSRYGWAVLLTTLLLLSATRIIAADSPTPTPTPADTIAYVVKNGDTLGSIASRYHTTISALMKLNNLPNAQLIRLGQSLQIPSAATETPAPPTDTETPQPSESTPVVTMPPASSTFDYGIEAFFDQGDPGSTISQIIALGMHWAKVDVSWRDLEVTRGSVDYSHFDSLVDALQAANLNILFTVSDAPDWARSSHLENGPPDNFNYYATFIGALATRYTGRVRAYEVWNEPNIRREWNSTLHPVGAASYADLLRAAYAAVKAADPNATVISAGLAPTGYDDRVNAIDDRKFLSDLYSFGLANMSDAVGAHPFGFANPPDSRCCDAPDGVPTHYGHPSFYFLDTLNDYHQIMIANGDTAKLIWVTQFGWGSSEDTPVPPPDSIYFSYTSLEKQAEYIPRAFQLAASSGFVGVMILYNLNGCTAQPVNAEACYYSLVAPSDQSRPADNALSAVFASATAQP